MSREIDFVMRALDSVVERVVRKISLDVVANLQTPPSSGFGTPIDTGWARANWIPNVSVTIDQVFGSPDDINAALSVQREGIADVLNYKLSRGSVRISNNVPYIKMLNEGSSPQAEPRFVERAIVKALTEDILTLAA